MVRVLAGAGAVALLVCAAQAQTEEAPAFEVASIKQAAPQPAGMMRVMMRGGPGTPDPGQLTFSNVTLKNVLMNAYDVKGYQIQGPGWLDTERYDITAKIPKGASKEQFRLMLQNLLAERFKVGLHRETKEMPIVFAGGGEGRGEDERVAGRALRGQYQGRRSRGHGWSAAATSAGSAVREIGRPYERRQGRDAATAGRRAEGGHDGDDEWRPSSACLRTARP